jgi:hypothetical protein
MIKILNSAKVILFSIIKQKNKKNVQKFEILSAFCSQPHLPQNSPFSIETFLHRALAALPITWWRLGEAAGFHCRSDGRKACKFAQTFGRVTARPAPNRLLSAGIIPKLLHFNFLFR